MSQPYYFSKRLRAKLTASMDYPLSVIMAGSGFGKTTAITECLQKDVAAEYLSLWYTCLGESTDRVWHSLCRLLQKVDDDLGKRLKSFFAPTGENCGEIAIEMMSPHKNHKKNARHKASQKRDEKPCGARAC